MVVNAVDDTSRSAASRAHGHAWNGHVMLDNGDEHDRTRCPSTTSIAINPGNTAQVDIIDSGGGSGEDDLVVFGSNQADTIELNSAGAGASAVGFVQASVTSQDAISYQGVERARDLHARRRRQHPRRTTPPTSRVVDMGGGDDNIVVGTVPLVPDPGNRTLEYPNGVPVADTQHMTNGNTASLFVLGGTQNDNFEVNHNRGLLYLARRRGRRPVPPQDLPRPQGEPGQAGHGHEPDDALRRHRLEPLRVPAERAGATSTAAPASTRSSSTARRSPTRSSITETYIAGAGRIVTFTGIEAIEVDGGGGADQIWILGTKPNSR